MTHFLTRSAALAPAIHQYDAPTAAKSALLGRLFGAQTSVAAIGFGLGVAMALPAWSDMWIQVEAQPTLNEARARVIDYGARLGVNGAPVNGFDLGGGWYGIALGPFEDGDAEARLRALRAQGLIPQDSFLADGSRFLSQFWPIGVDGLAALAAGDTVATTEPAASDPAEPAPTPAELDTEPLSESRRAEAALTKLEREEIQIALAHEGYYNSGIDGSFGRGTRGAIEAWQIANGYKATGVLSTMQHRALLGAYQAFLDALGMARVSDDVAGISIDLPLAMVEFARYAPPYAQFDAIKNSGVRVLLISQSGDETTLGGLYEIMQTLEIVPLKGSRSRNKTSFEIEGTNDLIQSYTFARLENGQVKGFTLVWPTASDANAQKLRGVALAAMKDSFTSTAGVLPDAYGEGARQDIDLMAGLKIRRPKRARSGFYVDAAGSVLTTSDAVDQCASVTLDQTTTATVVAVDGGLALLRPTTPLAPLGFAQFQMEAPRLTSEVAISGYSFEGRLGAPTLTYGTLADTKGLDNETGVLRLGLAPLPGDAGAPVLATNGGVIGLLQAPATDGRIMPQDVSFAADTATISAMLKAAGVAPSAFTEGAEMAPTALFEKARDMSVLVNCWQ